MVREELAKLGDHDGADAWMLPPFGFPKTFVGSLVAKAVETFRVVEVEIVPRDFMLEAQKSFDLAEFLYGVLDEQVSVHN